LTWAWLVLLIVLFYVSGGVFFAAMMLPFKSDFVFDASVRDVNFETLFYFACSQLISLGAEYGFANSRGAHWLMMLVHFCGILMNLLLFGVLLAKFTHKPSGLILGKMVLSKVAGKPCLTFRVGHIRAHNIIHPTFRVAVVTMKSVEDPGSNERYVAPFPLKIVGGRAPFCPPSYYYRHFIDAESPFYDCSSVSSTIFESVFRNASQQNPDFPKKQTERQEAEEEQIDGARKGSQTKEGEAEAGDEEAGDEAGDGAGAGGGAGRGAGGVARGEKTQLSEKPTAAPQEITRVSINRPQESIESINRPQEITRVNVTKRMLTDSHTLSTTADVSLFNPIMIISTLVAQDPNEVGFSSALNISPLHKVVVNHAFVDCLKQASTPKNQDSTVASGFTVDFESFQTTRPLDLHDEQDVHNVLAFGDAGESGKDIPRPMLLTCQAAAAAVKVAAMVAAAATQKVKDAGDAAMAAVDLAIVKIEQEAKAAAAAEKQPGGKPGKKGRSSRDGGGSIASALNVGIRRSTGGHSNSTTNISALPGRRSITALGTPRLSVTELATGLKTTQKKAVEAYALRKHSARMMLHGANTMYRAKYDTTARTPRLDYDLYKHGCVDRLLPVLFDTFHWAQSLSWWDLTFLVISAYMTIALLFALVMLPFEADLVLDASANFEQSSRLEKMLYFSSAHLVSMGVEWGYANSRPTHVIVMAMHFCSSLMNLLLFGVMLAKFSTKKSGLIIAPKICLSTMEGVPCLTFRIGHMRGADIVQPEITVTLIGKIAASSLGAAFYVPVPVRMAFQDLKSWIPPSYYFRHFIDEQSPFYDKGTQSGTIFDRTLGGDKSAFVRVSDRIRQSCGLPHNCLDLMLAPTLIGVTISAFDPLASAHVTHAHRFPVGMSDVLAVNTQFKDALMGANAMNASHFEATEPIEEDSPHHISISLSAGDSSDAGKDGDTHPRQLNQLNEEVRATEVHLNPTTVDLTTDGVAVKMMKTEI
jgi:hypothetical protein